jgi:predicted phosphoadenosine phosphosulfate sulfurtransferase
MDVWMREKDPISIKENKYNTYRFHELFEAIFKHEFKNIKSCYLAGVRTEEAPKRFVSLTNGITYKWITWGKKLYDKYEHYTFYPLYDWSYTDIWKYIYDNKIKYNKVYDGMYRHGVKVNDMRISNLHHETAVQVLLLVQEIEPDTWNKVVDRIDGASSIKHIKNNSYQCPKELPYMFTDWEDYTYHLIDNLIQEDIYRDSLIKIVNKKKILYSGDNIKKRFWKVIINTILTSDWDFTKIANFEMAPASMNYRNYKNNKIKTELLNETYIRVFTKDEINDIKNKLLEL